MVIVKVKKLHEDVSTLLNEASRKDIEVVREQVRMYLDTVLSHALDNIAIAAVDEVPGYDADWCYAESYGEFMNKLTSARLAFVDSLEAMLFANAPLNESLLMEGPLKDILRTAKNNILDTINPAGAPNRYKKQQEKDTKNKERDANIVIYQDFDKKNAKATFYLNHDYTKPYTYKQWCDMFLNISKDDGTKYAQWYNAIAVDENGYYIRRGAEDMRKKLTRFLVGFNDEVAEYYTVDPYKYNPKTKKSVGGGREESNPETDEKPKEETKPTAEQPSVKKKKKAPAPQSAGPDATQPKQTTDNTAQPEQQVKTPAKKKHSLTRFQQLARTVALDVRHESDPNKKVGYNAVRSITPETMDQYKVYLYDVKKPLSIEQFIERARKAKFLESLNQRLNESPLISLNSDERMDPSVLNLNDVVRRHVDKETADKIETENDKKRAKLKELLPNILDAIESKTSPIDKLSAVFDIVVPSSGKADSVAGEYVRAVMRLLYRDFNDGDKFFEGYGLETCGSSAQYLYDNGFETIETMLEQATTLAEDDDRYTSLLENLAEEVIKKISEDTELWITLNTVDSRDYDSSYIEECQPRYEFEFYGNDDIVALVDDGILDSWKLIEYVKDQLSWDTRTRECETERPWTHHDTSVTVTNLTKDGLEYIEEDLFRDVDRFWENLVDEYADELTDEDDMDESILTNESTTSRNKLYFSEDDKLSFGLTVLDHINETFTTRFYLTEVKIDDNVISVIVTDGEGEFSAEHQLDMTLIHTSQDIKKYVLDIAASLIESIKQTL